MNARLPIRWTLTLWYSGLLLATLVLVGLGVYLGIRTVLFDNLREQARQQAGLIAIGLDLSSGRPALDQETLDDFDDGERFLRILAADGSTVIDTSNETELSDDDLGELDPRSDDGDVHFVDGDGGAFAVALAPIERNDEVAGVVQVGLSRDDADDALQTIVYVGLIAIPLALVVAIAGGYLVSRRALAPVRAITGMASAIQAEELGTRLNLALPDDELGRLASAFDAMLARIDAAFGRQRQFTGDAAHELRTPLSLMRSQIDLALSRERTSEEYRDALQSLGGDVERLTNLVAVLLTLARSDAGRFRVDREAVDLAAVIAPLLDAYAPQAEETGVQLVDESTPAPALVDEDLIVQLLVNLVDNALAHTPRGGRIAVGCATRNGAPVVWVADTGDGIPVAQQSRIFERFYRVDAGRTRAAGGTGLGLAICSAIAAAHGGSISVESTPGAGARFTLQLPAAT